MLLAVLGLQGSALWGSGAPITYFFVASYYES